MRKPPSCNSTAHCHRYWLYPLRKEVLGWWSHSSSKNSRDHCLLRQGPSSTSIYGSKWQRDRVIRRKKRIKKWGMEEEKEKGREEENQVQLLLLCLQRPVKKTESSVTNTLLQINKTAALPPSNFVAKQFAKGKRWNLDIPFSCFRNVRTLNLVGFEIDGIN